ncbi:MAG: hypothetical protein ACOC38_06125 [Promethearchaeia archaeon]
MVLHLFTKRKNALELKCKECGKSEFDMSLFQIDVFDRRGPIYSTIRCDGYGKVYLLVKLAMKANMDSVKSPLHFS